MGVLIRLNPKAKTFHLSASVCQGSHALSQLLSQFFSSLSQEKNGTLTLAAKVPFSLSPQSHFRKEFYEFARKTKECRKLFRQIAFYEQLRDIDAILDL